MQSLFIICVWSLSIFFFFLVQSITLQIKEDDLKCSKLVVAKKCLKNQRKIYEAQTQEETLKSVVKHDIYHPNVYK